MKPINAVASSVLALCFGLYTIMPCGAAEPESAIPSVIQGGFVFFQKQHPEKGMDAWKEGGLVGEEFPLVAKGNYFKQAERTLGKYVSYELITTRMIGKSSKVVYVSINYTRGAVYARFLVYRTEQDWVVQSMDFNTRPEALMPWLAFEAEQ